MNYNLAEFENSYGLLSQLPESDEPEIAFSGRSNVGKSSLLNKLLGRKKLARVSSVPGKTVTVNFFDVDGVKFVDLPGYGYAKISRDERKRFSELTEGYFNSERNIKLVVQLVDMRRKPSEDDYNMMEFLKYRKIPFIIVMTKADKLKKKEYKRRLEESAGELKDLKNVPVIPFSAVTGEGVEKIKKCLEEAVKNE